MAGKNCYVETKERALIKVTFDYDDGTATYLDGKDLEKWRRANNAAATMQFAHGGRSGFEDIKWKRVKK